MEYLAAFEVVRSLIDGVNPLTNEKLPKDSIYNDPHVIRALLALIESASQPKRKRSLDERRADNLSRRLPPNTGLPWSPEDRESVAGAFRAATSIEKIAEMHGRTRVGIAAELQRQGLISTEEAARWGVIARASRNAAA